MNDRPRRRVLVVDDEPSVREMLSDFLEMNNFICTQADNGQSALLVSSKEKFDLIIMDVRMPVVSGIEALREIKRMQPRQPVVMVTALAEVETAVEAMRLGANDYVLKPFVLRDMLSKVDQAIQMGIDGRLLDGDVPGEDDESITVAVGTPLPIEETDEEPGPGALGTELAAIVDHVENLYEEIRSLRSKINTMVLQPKTRVPSALHLAPSTNGRAVTGGPPHDDAA